MPPKRNAARASKPTHQDHDTIEEDSEPQPPPPKKAKGRVSTRVNDRHLNVADDLHTAPPASTPGDTQQMAQMAHMAQVLAKQDSKKDSFAAKFVKQLKKQRDEVAELAKKGDRDSDSQNDEFIKSFNAQVAASLFVLGSSAPRKTSKSTPAADPIFELCTSHPLYSASVAYGELAQSAIRTYESACEAVDKSKPEHVLGEKWQEENDSLVEILEVGKRVTQREIDRMMMKKGADVEMGDQGRLHEEQEKAMARAVLGMEQLETGNGESGLPWIESMRCAERGAKRLAAGLPMVVE